VVFTVAHSPVRELEVLHDRLLKACHDRRANTRLVQFIKFGLEDISASNPNLARYGIHGK